MVSYINEFLLRLKFVSTYDTCTNFNLHEALGLSVILSLLHAQEMVAEKLRKTNDLDVAATLLRILEEVL